MLWDKKVYNIRLHGGKARLVTEPMRGLIQHMMVIPATIDTVWSMSLTDKDGDKIYDIHDHDGRLDDREGIPVGRDTQQPLEVNFYESTKNELFSVIFKIKEV